MRTRSLEDMTWEATMICLKAIVSDVSDNSRTVWIKMAKANDRSVPEEIAYQCVSVGRAVAEESIKNEVTDK